MCTGDSFAGGDAILSYPIQIGTSRLYQCSVPGRDSQGRFVARHYLTLSYPIYHFPVPYYEVKSEMP